MPDLQAREKLDSPVRGAAHCAMSAREPNCDFSRRYQISRRSFLATSLAGGAALMAGGLPSFLRAEDVSLDATIVELQAWLTSGAITSTSLTDEYLRSP